MFDLQGQPVQGVAVSVGAMGRLLRDPEGDPDDFGLDGPEFLRWKQAKGLPAWPRPALTDAQGRFTVRGAGQDLRAILAIDDPRFASQNINVDTDNTPNSKPVILAVQPARSIVGRVVAADTGNPIAHATAIVGAMAVRYRRRRSDRSVTIAGSAPGPNSSLSATSDVQRTGSRGTTLSPGRPRLLSSPGQKGRSSIGLSWPCPGES